MDSGKLQLHKPFCSNINCLIFSPLCLPSQNASDHTKGCQVGSFPGLPALLTPSTQGWCLKQAVDWYPRHQLTRQFLLMACIDEWVNEIPQVVYVWRVLVWHPWQHTARVRVTQVTSLPFTHCLDSPAGAPGQSHSPGELRHHCWLQPLRVWPCAAI